MFYEAVMLHTPYLEVRPSLADPGSGLVWGLYVHITTAVQVVALFHNGILKQLHWPLSVRSCP
jgi:hypothetical protein